jgi:hypothetical protein
MAGVISKVVVLTALGLERDAMIAQLEGTSEEDYRLEETPAPARP